MSVYYLKLLGAKPEVWKDDEVVFKQLQPCLFLAYLHCNAKQFRLDIANLFFPDIVGKQKRLARLSELIRVIDRAIPDAIQKSDDDLYISTDMTSDIEKLRHICEQEEYELIDEVYQGHFLLKVDQNRRLNLVDNESLYSWLLKQREVVLDVARDGLLSFAELKAAQEDFAGAAKLAKKIQQLSTEHSFFIPETYQRFYTLLRAADKPDAISLAKEAIEHYGQEEITRFDDCKEARNQLLTPNNLVNSSEKLIGRDVELAEVSELLRDELRMLTLFGPAGIGKTSFAKALTRNLRGYKPFRDGIYAVWLEELGNAADVVERIAQTLQFQVPASRQTLDFLCDMIGQKAMLLYLDNFEHLLEATGDVDALLECCPNLKIVISTREVVPSDWSHLYSLEGLDYPEADYMFNEFNVECVLDYAAVKLFVTQAKKANKRFKLSEDNVVDVIAICQQVKGLALALKLAASWLGASTAKVIATELSTSFDLLDDVQEIGNQRGMSASLEHSWERLTEAEQLAFSKLAVFQGGFTFEAAKDIGGLKIAELRALQRKSLLEWDSSKERYSLHPLIRSYVVSKAEAIQKAHDLDALRTEHNKEHMQYYLNCLMLLENKDSSVREQASSKLIFDLENIFSAWRQATKTNELEVLRESAHSLEMFCDMFGFYLEGVNLFRLAVGRIVHTSKSDLQKSTLANIQASQAWLLFRLCNYKLANELALESLKLAEGVTYNRALLTSLNTLGSVSDSTGEYAKAQTYFKKTTHIYEDKSFSLGTALLNLAVTEWNLGDNQYARSHICKAIEIFIEHKNDYYLSRAYNFKGQILFSESNFEESEKILLKANELASSKSFTSVQLMSLIYLALVNVKYGKVEKAITYSDKAQNLSKKLKTITSEIYCEWVNAQIEQLKDNHKIANQQLLSALKKAIHKQNNQLVSIVLTTLIKSLCSQGRNDIASVLLSDFEKDTPLVNMRQADLNDLKLQNYSLDLARYLSFVERINDLPDWIDNQISLKARTA